MLLQYYDGIKRFARLHRLIAILLLKPASSRTCSQWCLEENAGTGRMLGVSEKNNNDECADSGRDWYTLNICHTWKSDTWYECTKQCSSHCAGHCIDGGPTAAGFSVSARDFSDYAGLEEKCQADSTPNPGEREADSTSYPYCCCSYKKDDPLAFLEANLPSDSCSSRCMGLAAGSGSLKKGEAPLCSAQCSAQCPATNYCEAASASTFTDYTATSGCTTEEQQVCCCDYPQLTTVARLRLLRTNTRCTTWIDPMSNGTVASALALVNLGDAACTTGSQCSACQGDCDTDADCLGNLKCFQRSSNVTAVPLCASGGSGDTDYCYEGADTDFTINIYSNLDFRNGACHQVQSAPSNASIVSWNTTQVATPGSYKIACLADSQEEFQFFESTDCSGEKSSYFTLSMAGVSTFLHQGLCTEATGTFGQVQLDRLDISSYIADFRSGCETQTAISDVTLPFQSPAALYINMYKKFGTVSFARSLPIAVFAITISFLVGESQ